jgi:hypothetical protein
MHNCSILQPISGRDACHDPLLQTCRRLLQLSRVGKQVHNCAIRTERGPTVWAHVQVLADRSRFPVVERAKGERRELILVRMQRHRSFSCLPLLNG